MYIKRIRCNNDSIFFPAQCKLFAREFDSHIITCILYYVRYGIFTVLRNA